MLAPLHGFAQSISIHTALAGCDEAPRWGRQTQQVFQSTQPSQAVTVTTLPKLMRIQISIHTALAGCDITEDRKLITLAEFQSTQPSQAVTPTSGISVPYPGRFQSTQPSQAVTLSAFFTWMRLEFQSTQPSQAVTERKANPQKLTIISIHTALAGCDII